MTKSGIQFSKIEWLWRNGKKEKKIKENKRKALSTPAHTSIYSSSDWVFHYVSQKKKISFSFLYSFLATKQEVKGKKQRKIRTWREGTEALEDWRCWRPADWSHLPLDEASMKFSEYCLWCIVDAPDLCACLPNAFIFFLSFSLFSLSTTSTREALRKKQLKNNKIIQEEEATNFEFLGHVRGRWGTCEQEC